MKKILFLVALFAITITASAQYNTSGIAKYKGKWCQNGEKLNSEQIAALLVPYHYDNNISYSDFYIKARKQRNTGIILTTVGSIASVTGAFVFLYGTVATITGGTVGAITGEKNNLGKSELIIGTVTTIAGVGMLGAGIPILCKGKKKIKTVINDYNTQLTRISYVPEPTLTFGPCQNGGLGLSLKF